MKIRKNFSEEELRLYPELSNEDNVACLMYILSRINEGKNAIGMTFGGTGCQPKNSKVLMANGEWKNVEDIKIGDKVISPQKDGSNIFAKVINLSNFYSNKNYKVNELNRKHRELYTCSYNHLIPTFNRKENRITIKGKRKSISSSINIKNYNVEYFSKLSKNKLSHNNIGFSSFLINKFEGITNCEIEPYTLGVFLGDGMFIKKTVIQLNKNYNHDRYNNTNKTYRKFFYQKKIVRLEVTGSKNDYAIMEEVSKHYPLLNITLKKNTDNLSYVFSVNSDLVNLLSKYGLANKKSGDKFIPKAALLSDSEYRKRLLAGLIDTDGYYTKGGYSIVSKSLKLINGIHHLVYSLGGRGSIRKIQKQKQIKKLNFKATYYDFSFYLKDLILPIRLRRKIKDINSIYLSSNRVAINAIETKGSKVYGFELDSPSGLYITDNWMVTHNSGKSWVDLRIAELLCVMQGRKFDTANRVIFGLNKFLDYTNIKNLPAGDVSIPEELGVSMGSREWQRNIDYSKLLQTFRNLQTICLFNAPFKTMIDKHARLLAHFQIEMMGREGTMNVTKFFVLQHNVAATSESKTTYKKYLRAFKENEWGFSRKTPIKKLYWNKPSQDVLDIYIPMQDEFKRLIRHSMKGKEKKKKEDRDTSLKRIGREMKAAELFKKGISKKDIAGLLHIDLRSVSNYIKKYKELGRL